ncbi:uncharacterized protein PITG_18548 [Phytophthora infestans T30-4]|uniref:Uncharacterized protein n=1 Tax=Phytophthora infestans (strain T30-4) TaxID=403677 RepID=D0NYB2_PHYIT|nr:uncharacterized protein PITG_18548 [Phytophthora infestans T30-4]EEY68101.1 hypothetical protein PITG_18548 [Phytophthora infestans T30-4]|eukprot:XP_002997659.1 hypothetical protein PITG_18548 [Phytophthora infestans T30-4]
MHSTFPEATSMLYTLIPTVALEYLLHLSLNSARILLRALECMPGDTVEDALVVGLREVDYMLVFADNLRNNSVAIPKSMVAMVDENLECTNSIDRITEITFFRISALLLIATV